MRLRRFVTHVAFAPVFTRVFVASHFPAADAMTFTALIPKEPIVSIKMTCSAKQIIAQDSMIHRGDGDSKHLVLLMTNQAVLSSLVKTDFFSQDARAFKFMASETLFVRYALPRFMAGGAILDVFMKKTQGSRLSGCVIEEKPPGKGEHEENTEYLIDISHHSHLTP